jgi:alanyl-tRNA synthetase
MRSHDIRQRFLSYFERRGHQVVPSASLIAPDPTLLLVNAGMVPFKPYFLGETPAPHPRMASVQKCVRTVDIENVGRTARHCSFFQMAGNFSFGDYFKEQAIPFAWELATTSASAGGFGLDPDRLWITVYVDDDEAQQIWRDVVGVPTERVQQRGKEDNYWSMGVPGPCGPCSEIYYDRGPQYGRAGGPVADEDRYLEFWNLVFMQYERGPGAGYDYPILGDLPAKNIDTGLGVDRLATILQGVDNIYETDMVRPILDRAGELTGCRYGADEAADVRLRIVADHIRTGTMLIADGVVPTNDGRGYVLRRMLRRAVRNLRLLGRTEPAVADLVGSVRDSMSDAYPELVADFRRIAAVAAAEEESFLTTLRTGTTLFDQAAADARGRGAGQLAGDRAFTLHDTYGFPIELTLEMAAEQGLTVDEEGFRRLMAEQRERAQADARARKTGHVDMSVYRSVLDTGGSSQFVGYTDAAAEATVRGLLCAGEPAAAAGPGDEVELTLDRTPFYAESGGQLADTGRILIDGGLVEVLDVQRPLPELIVHRARVVAGELRVGAAGVAEVDVDRRRSISRSHTATHLLHQTIRAMLGDQAAQAGSENAPGRLRFDFTSPTAVSSTLLSDVEDQVNSVLAGDLPVRAFVTSQDEARRLGALALFGEKYGAAVRVVEVGDYARELCGGTHTARSGQIGLVKLLHESSIGAGIRRVEGLVGIDAFRHLVREHALVAQLAELVKAPPADLPDRVAALLARLREAERALDRHRARELVASAPSLAADAADENGVLVAAHRAADGTTGDDLRRLALEVRNQLPADRAALVVLTAVTEGRPLVVVAANPAAQQQGLAAGALVGVAARTLGGGGGGRPDVAQGGGTDAGAVDEALAAVRRHVRDRAAGS